MRQTTGGDAFFLYTDRESRHQHISLLYVYDQSSVKGGPLRFKQILDHVRSRLDSSGVYRQRLVQVPFKLDYPYWVDDPDFDLEFHVRHIALPKPGDWRQFCIQVSRLHSRPLDMSRPVWEMYVIEGLDNVSFLPRGSFAIMTKVHHVAIDGMAAAELTRSLHDLTPNPREERSNHTEWRPEAAPRPVELMAKAGFNNIGHAVRTGKNVIRQAIGSLENRVPGRSASREKAERAPVTRFNQNISPHRVWDAARFSLEDFKLIKNRASQATINDIVLTVCGGAMMHYLDSHGETPDLSLTAMVPVSVRSEKEQGAGGNKVHLTRTSLRTLERDPLKRLAQVNREMHHVKEINAVGAREMVELQEQLPAPTLLLAGRAVAASTGPGKTYRSKHNMVVTNVPGPQQPLYFCGARLVMFTGMAVITDNLGISHAVTSYDGSLVIAPLSDRAMMPDPAFYIECLERAFAELKTAVEDAGVASVGKGKTGVQPGGKSGKKTRQQTSRVRAQK